MVDRRLIDEEDVSKIGLRIKAARILSSYNQEEFAEKYKFGYASVKNWELGRSIPRSETFVKIIDALKSSGVRVTRDWLLYGSGSGPTHDNRKVEKVLLCSNANIEHEIYQFEKWCKLSKRRPLFSVVEDNSMAPFYFKGDYLGAIAVDISCYKKNKTKEALLSAPFLVEIEAGKYQPRFLRYDSSKSLNYFQSQQGNLVEPIIYHGLGKIVWLRRHI